MSLTTSSGTPWLVITMKPISLHAREISSTVEALKAGLGPVKEEISMMGMATVGGEDSLASIPPVTCRAGDWTGPVLNLANLSLNPLE